nr:uncharacterized protein LOC112709395 [Arachis hypogaea]
MVVKSQQDHIHKTDLEEVFNQIRKHNMMLNPEKCAFGVKGGKFFGFMLTARGIEANPEKCKTIINMRSPRSIKEIQQLNGRLVALSRFIPAISTLSQHFFNALKKQTRFNWNADLTPNAVSSVLVTEVKDKQKPVYFVSKSLQNAELRYPPTEKLAYALILTTRRLRHYFQSNQIIVKTNQPLRQILTRPDVSGRLTKWSIELSEFDIIYEPRIDRPTKPRLYLELYVDGASNAEGSGAGVYLTNKHDLQTEQSIRFSFQTSNNQAEYEALLAGLRLAQSLNITHLQVYCDSQLVVQQVTGHFQVKDQLLEKYHTLVRDLIPQFHSVQITHIAQEQNTRADALSKLATTKDPRTFKRRAASFTLIETDLYKRGFSQPLPRCLSAHEARVTMDDAHEGVCGNHARGMSLASKIARAGYYWPTMQKDCINKVRRCDSCQKPAPLIHNPAEQLHTSEVSWPFDKWEVNIFGPFPKAPSQGFQVKHHFSSVEHPQTNGLTEAANKVILTALKKKLGEAKGDWANLIPEILWSYNTTKQTTTQETPYRLVYGANTVIPIETAIASTRAANAQVTNNTSTRQIELDTIEEDRTKVELRHKAMQQITQ